MKHILGFTQSHWMLSLGERLRLIAPAAVMDILVGRVKKRNTQQGFS
jgi:hypothetical protein